MATNGYKAPEYTIFDIYKLVFGYRAVPYPMGALNRIVNTDLNDRLSKLGAALFTKDENGREAFCPVTIRYKGKAYELPYSTIGVQLQKNIQQTALPGRNGSVKELIQVEDYRFTINGVILSDDDLPEDFLMSLNELFLINEPVKLENAFAEIFISQDNSVVIENMVFPDMKGISRAQAYSISLLSDTILTIEE